MTVKVMIALTIAAVFFCYRWIIHHFIEMIASTEDLEFQKKVASKKKEIEDAQKAYDDASKPYRDPQPPGAS